MASSGSSQYSGQVKLLLSWYLQFGHAGHQEYRPIFFAKKEHSKNNFKPDWGRIAK